MIAAAVWPRDAPASERLLVVDRGAARLADRTLDGLPDELAPGDLLVVNDAATLPASFAGRLGDDSVELRLAGARGADDEWDAVLFGAGDWRTRTEDRAPPPVAHDGDVVVLDGGLTARIEEVSELSPRLVRVRFDRLGAPLWRALYRAGRPVQYAHVAAPLPLWHVQTRFAARPWAVEAPSAGRPLTWSVLNALRRRGVQLAALTHAAGLSATGDPVLDAALPLPERYDLPAPTVEAVRAARASGHRVIAAGTTVVRALEDSAARHGDPRPGAAVATVKLGPRRLPRVVDGILTGIHEPGTSHHQLLEAFAPRALLDAALAHASAAGYLGHEFGDLMLVR